MREPLVSIIIPSYNEEKYIQKCLDSLLNQTYKKREIILVDDGSNDRTLEIAKKFPLVLLSQKHKGPGLARNYGASKAKGEILVFADSDMIYEKDYIKRLIAPILKGSTVGTFNKELIANKNNIWSRCWSINSDLKPGERDLGNDKELNIFRAIKKDLFDKISGFNPNFGYYDDRSLSEKLCKKALLAKGAISYHFNPESLSEVFFSSRWIGRGGEFNKSFSNFFRFSILNSIRNSTKKVSKGAPFYFLVFKIVYDFGVFNGVFLSKGKKEK